MTLTVTLYRRPDSYWGQTNCGLNVIIVINNVFSINHFYKKKNTEVTIIKL